MKYLEYLFNKSSLKDHPELLNKVGGKARNLYHLTNENIPVPKWWCLSTDLFLNDQLLKEIIEKSEFQKNIFYAVRSSANIEDGADASFSGQFKSLLYVPHQKIESAIKECWHSAAQDNVTEYLNENNIPKDELKMGVIIQEMVNSKKAGVLFTIDPTATFGKRAMAIVAGFGQGEGIVSSQVEADTYYIDREENCILESKIEIKNSQLVYDHQNGYGLKTQDIALEKKESWVLSKQEIETLVEIAKKIETYYGCPQDIEWAIDEEDRLHIVQSRPITTLKLHDDEKQEEHLLDNANIVESFPGLTLPLTQSFVMGVYEKTFISSFKLIGFSENEIKKNHRSFSHLIHFYKGYSFYNLTSWFSILQLIPFSKKYIETWKLMLGVSQDLNITNKPKRNLLETTYITLRSSCYITYRFWNLKKELTKLKEKETNSIKEFYSLDNCLPENRSELEIIFAHFEESYSDWAITLLNDAYAFIYVGICQEFWKIFYKRSHGEFLSLLEVKGKIDSIAPVHSLNNLIEQILHDSKLSDEIESFIKNNSKKDPLIFTNKLFNESLKKHLYLYGDRCFGELKLETITYRENPILFLKLLLNQKQGNNIAPTFDKKTNNDYFLNFFAKKARNAISERENFRLLRSMKYGVIRRYCWKIGEDLYNNKAIEMTEDIFYLDRDDIYSYYNHSISQAELKSKILKRKKEFCDYSKFKISTTYLLKKTQTKNTYQEYSVNSSKPPTEFKNKLKGIPCSKGKVQAKALVVIDPSTVKLSAVELSEYILVTKTTDPGWVFLMKSVKGLIVERGSILSHSAIIGRELGLPTIISVANATTIISPDTLITMDGETGDIFVN